MLQNSQSSRQAAGFCRPLSAKLKAKPLPPARSANIGQGTPAGPANVPETLRSAHPDALRRRKQAEARRAAAQVEAETAQRCNWWEGPKPCNLVAAVSIESLQHALAQDRLVVVDFFAPWCAACRRLFPKLLQLAENNPDVLFVKVNGGDDKLSKYVEGLGVDRLPYFHFYRRGELLAHFAANLTRVNLLRAELAAHKECTAPNCII